MLSKLNYYLIKNKVSIIFFLNNSFQ